MVNMAAKMAPWQACLLYKCETPSLNPQHPYKNPGMAVYTLVTLVLRKEEAGGSQGLAGC